MSSHKPDKRLEITSEWKINFLLIRFLYSKIVRFKSKDNLYVYLYYLPGPAETK